MSANGNHKGRSVAKVSWPVAKVREDGTPAIWFSHSHWLLLKDSIVSGYLNARQGLGAYRARRDARQALGKEWYQFRDHATFKYLKNEEVLDAWPMWEGNAKDLLRLHEVGCDAYLTATNSDFVPSVGKVIEWGDKWEKRGYDEEQKKLPVPTWHDRASDLCSKEAA